MAQTARILLNRFAAILFLSTLAVTLTTPFTECQGAAISGRVYVRNYLRDLVPAGFSTIIVKGDSFETIIRTDIEGYYFAHLPAGTYELTATLSTATLEYAQTKTVTLWYTSDTTVNFYLEPVLPIGSGMIKVTIMADGLRPEYQVNLFLDGSLINRIPGGGRLTLEVDPRFSHIFTVESYAQGIEGERFHCREDSWTLEASSGRMAETGVSHTFKYEPEYYLSVSTPYGDAGRVAGWYPRGTMISLSTPTTVEVSAGVKDVFYAWAVSGSRIRDSTVSIDIQSPVKAVAEYRRMYYLELVSAYGNPSGSGWYEEGANAEISVEQEVASPGLAGLLGGRMVFTTWTGGTASSSNTGYVTMDSQKMLVANWRIDNSIPYIVIASTLLVIIAAGVLLQRRKT
ncbi:hypothetical protein KEJ39_05425 [Candidatus Bathyarchaeota archaeon]|nr:hypothetical protein [Candidatus Bathyarchaeota archaeon]